MTLTEKTRIVNILTGELEILRHFFSRQTIINNVMNFKHKIQNPLFFFPEYLLYYLQKAPLIAVSRSRCLIVGP